jgi:hypothetical protein
MSGAETTDLSSYISSNNTYYTIEIVLSLTSVKFYVDNVLRATHTTNVPIYTNEVVLCARNTNSVQTSLRAKLVEVWEE